MMRKNIQRKSGEGMVDHVEKFALSLGQWKAIKATWIIFLKSHILKTIIFIVTGGKPERMQIDYLEANSNHL